MKRGILIVFLLIASILTVSAEIKINNYSIDNVPSSLEPLKGEVNLTLTSEDVNIMIYSNDNDSIFLKTFLDFQNSDYDCSPVDCSSGYSSSNEISGIIFNFSSSEEKSLGFVFSGGMINIEGINFAIESDFAERINQPLSVDFFGEDKWAFEKFSNTFLEKDWGCYNTTERVGARGFQIGKNPYCELIYIPETDKIRIGAKIGSPISPEEPEDKNLTMYLYSKDSGEKLEDCNYFPKTNEFQGCIIDEGDMYLAGDYYVCVGSQDLTLTRYEIYFENVGNNCGFPYGSSPVSSTNDYAIFAQAVRYANYTFLEEEFDFDSDDITEKANRYLIEKYGGTESSGANCSNECILPFTFSGTTQRARIKDIEIVYQISGGYTTSNEIYELEVTPATISFDGLLDLRLLDFNISKTMNYILKIGDEIIFSKRFNVTSAPKILSIFPMEPVAGIPMKVSANVEFPSNKSLTYNWDMGDGTTQTTYEPYITHTYEKIQHYTIKLNVSAGGNLKDSEEFYIKTITPEAAIISGLLSRRNSVDVIKTAIDKTPFWYRQELSSIANIVGLTTTLDTLEKNYQGATSNNDYIRIAAELYEISVPVGVDITSFDKPYLMNDLDDINIEPILAITNDFTDGTSEDYAKAILSWQNTNIEASSTSDSYNILLLDGSSIGSLSAYTFHIKSNSNENSYFAIDAPLSSLYFGEDVGALESEDFTLIPIKAAGEGYFEFYYKSAEPLSYFVSPSLTAIVIESDIDTTCNYNSVCEENLGETYLTCRSDCKPVGKAILYGILAIFAVFILYTILQIWYNHRYEKYLFADGRELYNLLMFIANAKTRGMDDSKISSNLKRQGWSNERVAFVIKKANGKRTGLVEIIPISKISAILRNMKVANQQKKEAKQ
ncbi:PKD domain-containing protein, partial [Candidatus Pacearchaeota archaeon]|nr:PKD domain-containing protein [Candidatus Pacearchaeota archaeon]